MGFNNIPVLQHIIRDQHAARTHHPQHLWKEINILSLGRIHKDQIISLCQARQNICSISFKQSNPVSITGFLKIFPGYRDSLFIIFYRCDPAGVRKILAHQYRRKTYSGTHLQHLLRLLHGQKHPQKALHLPTNNRHIRLLRFLFQLFQKRAVTGIQ